VPGRKKVTLWVSARIAGTGQMTILVLQPKIGSNRTPARARRDRLKRINTVFLWRGLSLDFCPPGPDFSGPAIRVGRP